MLRAQGCIQYPRLLFIFVVAFEIGKESKLYCPHMWKFAAGFAVAGLNNRLDTMNRKPNRKHVDSKQSVAASSPLNVHIHREKKDKLGFRSEGHSRSHLYFLTRRMSIVKLQIIIQMLR